MFRTKFNTNRVALAPNDNNYEAKRRVTLLRNTGLVLAFTKPLGG